MHGARTPTLNVLYDDNHVIVVAKPAGIVVQGGSPSLFEQTKEWIAEKYNKPGAVYLGLVHRLDRSVSGLVMFARTSKAAARLSEQIRERAVEKIYHAWVEGTPRAGALRHWLREDDGYVTAYDAPGQDRKEARLSLRVLEAGRRSKVEVRLETGRKHQIRVQMSHSGHPIIGDKRYGARTPFPTGIALCAVSLRFKHPTRHEDVTVQLPDSLNPLVALTANS